MYFFFLIFQIFYKEFVHPEPLSPEKQEVIIIIIFFLMNECRSEIEF